MAKPKGFVGPDRHVKQTATSSSKVVLPEPPKTRPWKPADLLHVPDEIRKAHDPGSAFRWVRKDQARKDAKQDERWRTAHVPKGTPKGGDSLDSKGVTSAYERRDTFLMVMSPEDKQAREYYMAEENAKVLNQKLEENKSEVGAA